MIDGPSNALAIPYGRIPRSQKHSCPTVLVFFVDFNRRLEEQLSCDVVVVVAFVKVMLRAKSHHFRAPCANPHGPDYISGFESTHDNVFQCSCRVVETILLEVLRCALRYFEAGDALVQPSSFSMGRRLRPKYRLCIVLCLGQNLTARERFTVESDRR